MDPESLTKSLGAQMSAIAQAPIPFFVAVLILSFAAWRFAGWHYKSRLSDADSKVDLLETRISDYEKKLNGASPDEAKARIDALEARLTALEPKKIGSDHKARMKDILGSLRGSHIFLTIVNTSHPAQVLCGQVEDVFKQAGWVTHTPVVMGKRDASPSGLTLYVQDVRNLTAEEDLVRQALVASGIEFGILSSKPAPPMPGDPPPVAEIIFTTPFDV
jgi:hypothetical protein